MKGFKLIAKKDSEPEPKDPTPAIPIKIVTDQEPAAGPTDDPDPTPSGRRVDEFYPAWDKFLYVEPKRAKKTSRAARKLQEEVKLVEQTPGDGLHIEQNAATSWEQAAAECKAKVAAIEEECIRLNQKYRDALFDLEANSFCLSSLQGSFPAAVDKIDAPPWIKRVEDIFDKPEFFIDGATATDVHQGSGGDCWFLASLMAVSAKKELIDNLCVARNEKVGVYGFVFYRDGEWIYEVIDDKLYLRVGDDDNLDIVRDWDKEDKEGQYLKYDEDKLKEALQKGGEALYFSHCKSNETWLPLIEKAYAKAHGDYYAIEGGFASEGIEDLTGGVAVVLNPEDIMDKDRFWKEQLSQVNKKYLFGGGSKPSSPKGLISGHAYAVLEAWEEGDLRLVKIRNPWGDTEWEGDWSDGSKLWTAEMMTKLKHTFGDDGVFWMSYKDFLKHFPCINRVRLFDDSWKVGQQWSCVSVPWTVDYMDTKFQFTITERGPVVIVLAQPDDRYFYGLRGRYLHSLHFRVYKEGEESRWIVRSMHNSGNETVFTRSVSAEIEDLEPGTYDVIFKITTFRTNQSTAEENIAKYAIDRKEKLLNVGRRFDYAQSKGNLRGMEKDMRKSKKQDLKDKRNTAFKKDRKINQKLNERARKRKQRIHDAMRGKRKELREKAKAKRESKHENESTDAQPSTDTPPTSMVQSKLEEDPRADVAPKEPVSAGAEKPDVVVDEPLVDEPEKPKQEASAGVEKPNVKVDEPLVGEPEKPKAQSNSATDLSSDLQMLDIKDDVPEPVSPINPQSEDEEDSDPEPLEELDDDDFPWDSEMDGPVDTSDDDDDEDAEGLFKDDPWNALVVLGLRVYSKSKDVEVSVVKDEEVEEKEE